MKKYFAYWLIRGSTLSTFFLAHSLNAQIIPDNTLPINSVVTPQNDGIQQINNGTRAGNNLFHSFEQFSVLSGDTAFFDNALDVKNILSRVTGNSISDIQGVIKTNGAANLFLVNPNGIIFGKNASLQIGGSFIATTADSILFPDGEFSATDLDSPPLITINAPIGLNFRDNPQSITNSSFVTDETGDDLIGLRVPENQTIGLIGGDIFIKGGFVSIPGGRIELGSVGENSIVTLTEVDKGWDFSYEGVENFGDIDLSIAAFIYNFGENTGDIELQGRNISLIQGSQIGIDTKTEGKAGNLNIIATESISLDGNAIQAEMDDIPTLIFSNVFDEVTGEGSQIQLETPQLSITNGAQINATNDGTGKGVDIIIDASDIVIETAFINEELDIFQGVGIFTEVDTDAIGNGGNITIETETLNLNNGGQISTSTLGAGNAGNLIVNASKSIELIGTIPNSTDPSALFANVEKADTAVGNGGNLTVNTPKLVLKDGAQIASNAHNQGNGGNLEINVSESILISGTSPLAEFEEGGRSGIGRSGIFANAQPSFPDDEGNFVVTTGNGGILNLTTGELIVEEGAIISSDNFGRGEGGNATINVNNLIVRNGGQIGAGSLLEVDYIDEQRGAGGTLNINATESIEVTGTGDINGTPVKSSIFTLAEGTGNAGNLNITTNKLTVADGGEINASAIGTGAAGNLEITANNINLNNGSLTATTKAGEGGNIDLNVAENLTLRNNSRITAQAFEDANGGNIDIDAGFIIAYPSQTPNDGNDIIASAERGRGGEIKINTQQIFGLQERKASPGNGTNDIDASSDFGLDGRVVISNLVDDVNQGVVELPDNVVEPEILTAQACAAGETVAKGTSRFTITGRGGLPTLATDPLTSDQIQIAIVDTAQNSDQSAEVASANPPSSNEIVPARGMIVNEKGEIVLTAYPTTNTSQRTPTASVSCSRS